MEALYSASSSITDSSESELAASSEKMSLGRAANSNTQTGNERTHATKKTFPSPSHTATRANKYTKSTSVQHPRLQRPEPHTATHKNRANTTRLTTSQRQSPVGWRRRAPTATPHAHTPDGGVHGAVEVKGRRGRRLQPVETVRRSGREAPRAAGAQRPHPAQLNIRGGAGGGSGELLTQGRRPTVIFNGTRPGDGAAPLAGSLRDVDTGYAHTQTMQRTQQPHHGEGPRKGVHALDELGAGLG